MNYVEKSAAVSDCGRYRYSLVRAWDSTLPRLLFVMLNPSTADGAADDPTIRSCVRLAASLGFGSIEVANLYAWRATDPADLPAPPTARGPGNARAVEEALARCADVVCAWGAHPAARAAERGVLDLVELAGRRARCLGKTRAGAPRHPLYVRTGTVLEDYP